ncbi:MAG: PhzF family phenazine biosynthesis protein [Nocardia sp.]|nr:PhzF family phenazine biosynthesis protein [Nocardia sp.]
MSTADSEATRVEIVRVCTDAAGRFGNTLGIVPSNVLGERDPATMAALTGLHATAVLDEPASGRVRMRIHTPALEVGFAGYPVLGVAWWLADQGHPVKIIDVPAGPVEVQILEDGLVWIRSRAEWAPEFSFEEFADPELFTTVDPRQFTGGQHYIWSWTDETRGAMRARMFAPDMGIAEDQATGSAAIGLTAKLRRGLIITQGTGSQLFTEWDSDGWVRLGGRVAAEKPMVI